MFNKVRILLFLITLVGASTGVVWLVSPVMVAWVDARIEGLWMRRSWKVLRYAQELKGGGEPAAALEVLNDFDDSIGEVQIGDRLDRPWREAMRIRIELLEEKEDFAAAIAVSRGVQKQAPRDLSNRVMLGQLLAKTPEGKEEALEVLAAVNDLVPEWSVGADAYAAELIAQGREREALEAGFEFLRRGGNGQRYGWTFYWHDGTEFKQENSSTRDFEQGRFPGEYVLSLVIPQKTGELQQLRFDPPDWACLRASDWKMKLESTVGNFQADEIMELFKNPIEQEIRRRIRSIRLGPDGSIETRWTSKSKLYWELSEPVPLDGAIRVEFRARIEPIFFPAVADLLADSAKRSSLETWLAEEGRAEDLQLMRTALGE